MTLYGDRDEEAVYETVPAQTVDLAEEREKLVGEKVNASYDIENEKIIPSHAGVSFTLADLQSAYDAAAPGRPSPSGRRSSGRRSRPSSWRRDCSATS